MKSMLFGRFDIKNEKNKEFSEDLLYSLSLKDRVIDRVIEAVPSLVRARTNAEKEPLIEEVSRDTGMTVNELGQITAVIRFFIGCFHGKAYEGDTTEAWAEDLTELGVLGEKQAKGFLSFIGKLRSKLSEPLKELSRENKAEIGILPVLSSMSSTVEIRGVFEERFELGADVSAYKPKLIDVTPMISVAISLDSGTPSAFTFQASPRNLKYLIGELQVAIKCAEALAEKTVVAAESD